MHISKLIATHKNASVEIEGDGSLVGTAQVQITTSIPTELFNGENRKLQGTLRNNTTFHYSKAEHIHELTGNLEWERPQISFVNRKGIHKNIQTENITIDWHFVQPYVSIKFYIVKEKTTFFS